ncbi:hypothetical protein [Synechococcus sp. J7-Johnson]|nr:hypothetical protein [Synechococcus sp. J7-Johnson]
MSGDGSGDNTLASLAYGFDSEGRLRRSRNHSSLRLLLLEH